MTFTESIVGPVIGVLIGGAITYAGQRALESRRERRLERQETNQQTGEVRLAARLVLADLLAIAIWLKAFKATGNWWTRAQLPNGAWVEHGPSLSRMLSDRQWRDIAPVFTGVAQWNGVSSATRAVYRTRETIPFKCFPDIATLRDTLLDGAETAIQTLQTFALPETEDPTEFSKIVSSPLTSNSMSVIEQVKFAATDPVLRTLTVVGITWYLRQHVLRKQT